MGNKTIRTTLVVFVLFVLSACGSGGGESTLQIPELSSIIAVQASDNDRNESTTMPGALSIDNPTTVTVIE